MSNLQVRHLKLGNQSVFFIAFLASKIDFLSTFQAEKKIVFSTSLSTNFLPKTNDIPPKMNQQTNQ